jgi:hypothetical protein
VVVNLPVERTLATGDSRDGVPSSLVGKRSSIESGDVIMQWLVRWLPCYTPGTRQVQTERQKDKHCRLEIVPFGETFMFKKLKKLGQKKNILDSDWEEGLWLGHARTSTETLIGTTERVVRAWAIRRKIAEER